MPNALPRLAFPDEHRWQVSDTVSKIWGKHILKAGVDLNFIHEYLANLFQGGGVYSYVALNNQCLNPAVKVYSLQRREPQHHDWSAGSLRQLGSGCLWSQWWPDTGPRSSR